MPSFGLHVIRMSCTVLVSDQGHFRLCLLARHAGFQSAENRSIRIRIAFERGTHRHEDISLRQETKLWGHHAHDGIALPVN